MADKKPSASSGASARSAVTGRFVTIPYANAHKSTTIISKPKSK